MFIEFRERHVIAVDSIEMPVDSIETAATSTEMSGVRTPRR
jgi:hypothetical protein